MSLPVGWTLTEEDRRGGYEDSASAFTDGRQLTLTDDHGQRPPQAEWPTTWRTHAVAYAWSVASRRAGIAEPAPPYAPSPSALDMLPRQERAPVDRMFLRRWQRDGETVHPEDAEAAPEPLPDRVLANRDLGDALTSELVALCGPTKGVFGITKAHPGGQLGPGWNWRAVNGFGIRGEDGRITESVVLKFGRGPRVLLFLWTRPVPDPRLMHALAWQHCTATVGEPIGWPLLAAVLATLKAPDWSLKLATAWTLGAGGRPDDTPAPVASATVKKELRT